MTPDLVILALCHVLIGDGTSKDRGLMSRTVSGKRHLERCQIGMFLRPDDRLTSGSLCSTRCRH